MKRFSLLSYCSFSELWSEKKVNLQNLSDDVINWYKTCEME